MARSRSNSELAALANPRLSASLTDVSQGRSDPQRSAFERKVKRFLFQLTTGCGTNCSHKLCYSNPTAPHFSPEVAAAMAVQLASNPLPLFCPNLPPEADSGPIAQSNHTRMASEPNNHDSKTKPQFSRHHSRSLSNLKHFSELESIPKPFLTSLFSYPSFSSLFGEQKFIGSSSLSNMLISKSLDSHKLASNGDEFDSLSAPDSPTISENSEPLDFEKIGLKFLDLELLQIAVEPYKQSFINGTGHDYNFLLNSINGVFSSPDSLSKSFLTKEKSSNHSNLNIESVIEAYDIILNLEPHSIFQTNLIHSLELILSKMYIIVKKNQNPDPEYLRVILIILLNPFLQQVKFHESLVKKLCCIIGKIRSKSLSILVSWLSQLSVNIFSQILNIFKDFITEMGYSTDSKPEESFVGGIKAMSMLSNANEVNSNPILPYSEFYLNELSSKLNFKEEFKKWKRTLETDRVVEFSVFNFPFLFDPVAKTRIMHIDAMVKMSLGYEEAYVNQTFVTHAQKFLVDESLAMKSFETDLKESTNPYFVLEIRRAYLIQDVLDQILKKGNELKKPLKVKFVGGGEEGMDQGGVQKEFFQVLISELLDPAYGMFEYDEETRYSWFNSKSLEPTSHFELVGIIFGLALYNGVIVRVSFPICLYKKLLKEEITLTDIEAGFPSLGKGLRQLLEWQDNDVEDVFMRTFEITYEKFGKVIHIPLIDGGEDIMVNNSNRSEYVRLYINHFINHSIKEQFKAFQSGFYKVCGGQALKMCRPLELELMICGKATDEVEFHKLETGAVYDDGYSSNHHVIRWFWDIVHTFELNYKRKLLEFVTASERVPLKGLESLLFVIQRNGPDTDRLPTALTCFGRLLLPEYSSKEKLKERLMTAIDNAKGFGLV